MTYAGGGVDLDRGVRGEQLLEGDPGLQAGEVVADAEVRAAAEGQVPADVAADVDVVILGCTHYPLLFDVIEREAKAMIGDHVTILDSATVVAREVSAFLTERALARAPAGRPGTTSLFVTDLPRSFDETAQRFLGA